MSLQSHLLHPVRTHSSPRKQTAQLAAMVDFSALSPRMRRVFRLRAGAFPPAAALRGRRGPTPPYAGALRDLRARASRAVEAPIDGAPLQRARVARVPAVRVDAVRVRVAPARTARVDGSRAPAARTPPGATLP